MSSIRPVGAVIRSYLVLHSILILLFLVSGILFNHTQPKVLTLGLSQPIDRAVSYIGLYFTICGTLIGVLSAIFSHAAAAGSAKNQHLLLTNQQMLQDYGIIADETKGDFKTIYKAYLISQINTFQTTSGTVQLMLSSPAYGYAVLGAQEARLLTKSIANLAAKSRLEIICFSPESHWLYWANTLLWSYVREYKDKQSDFAVGFAKTLDEAASAIINPKDVITTIWISDSGPQRLFAFKKDLDSTLHSEDENSQRKAFLIVTDRMDLSLDQWQEQFHARGHRVFGSQLKQYIGNDDSLFERAKHCPYTISRSIRDEKDLGAISDQLKIGVLFSDFLFGRTGTTSSHTLIRNFDAPELATQEMLFTAEAICSTVRTPNFSTDAMPKEETLDIGVYLAGTLLHVLRYFEYSIFQSQLGSPFAHQSAEQHSRISKVLHAILGKTPPAATHSIDHSIFNDAISAITENSPVRSPNELAGWIVSLLCSGTRLGLYYKLLQRTA